MSLSLFPSICPSLFGIDHCNRNFVSFLLCFVGLLEKIFDIYIRRRDPGGHRLNYYYLSTLIRSRAFEFSSHRKYTTKHHVQRATCIWLLMMMGLPWTKSCHLNQLHTAEVYISLKNEKINTYFENPRQQRSPFRNRSSEDELKRDFIKCFYLSFSFHQN